MINSKSTDDVKICEAKPADAADLSLIHQACFLRHWNSRDFEDFIAASNISAFVAKSVPGSAPVGFILARRAKDEAEILSLAVKPRNRGKGFARKLCEICFASLLEQNVNEIFLEVGEANRDALNLYKSLGFKQIGRRKSYYSSLESGEHQDAILMKFLLKPERHMDQEAE